MVLKTNILTTLIIISLFVYIKSDLTFVYAMNFTSKCNRNLFEFDIDIEAENAVPEYTSFYLNTELTKGTLLFKCMIVKSKKKIEPAAENNGLAVKDVEFSEEIVETITEDTKKEEE